MSSSRDDRYYAVGKPRRTPPVGDSNAFFPTGQGGRTVLPPLSSAFPTSHFPATSGYHQYAQPRSTQGRYDYNPAIYSQWNNAPPPVPQSFTYYDNNDPRYGAQPSYAPYPSRTSTPIPDMTDSRRLAPLHTAGRDERWNPAPYPTPGHIPASSHNVRSPTASYPNQYEAYAVDPTHAYPYGQMPLSHASMNPHHPPQPRSTSPYRGSGEGASQAYTPPPVSPTTDEPMIKKKRKRADAQQLKVLNDVYNRTAFPSTEERMSLAKQLDMSPRSVQIWFQNKRQSMRQTNRQSSSLAPSSHQPFSMPSHEMDDLPAGAGYLSSSAALAGSSYPMGRTSPDVARSMHSTSPSVTHRRPRSAEETDPRIWSAGGRSH
ncbi:hypothetical protein HGRIS_002508 [Hohenbuehelia grisea]|uniref:Homeobox domain-containing protein n=1 Tax=Hohenbuehelia grisea TaxID=104357 RepID=A0ABR3JKQ8_9AGAR